MFNVQSNQAWYVQGTMQGPVLCTCDTPFVPEWPSLPGLTDKDGDWESPEGAFSPGVFSAAAKVRALTKLQRACGLALGLRGYR